MVKPRAGTATTTLQGFQMLCQPGFYQGIGQPNGHPVSQMAQSCGFGKMSKDDFS
jgi:hypothetical protein